MAARENVTNGNGSASNSPSIVATAGSGNAAPPCDSIVGDYDFNAALARLNVDMGRSELHPRQEPGTVQAGDVSVSLGTNVYALRSENIPVYQYHLELVKEIQVLIDGSKQSKTAPLIPTKTDGTGLKLPDYTTFENRKRNRLLVDALIAENPAVFGQDPSVFLYDFGSTLYSLQELKLPQTKLRLDQEAVQRVTQKNFGLACEIQLTRTFCSKDFESNFGSNLEEHRPDVVTFLELATSRFASLHPEEHVMYESKQTAFMKPQNYQMKSAELGGGKYLVPGASKTVQLVQGSNGAPAVVIDSKKTPFYHSMNLLQMISAGANFDPKNGMSDYAYSAAEKYVKNLEVFPLYGQRQSIPITLKGFATGDAKNNFIPFNGEEISIETYFSRRYQIQLQFPQLPLVVGARKIGESYPLFPVELLWVADCQRVKNSNITPMDIATIVKSCAVPPAIKSNEIKSCHSSFGFHQDGFLKAATIQLSEEPMQVQGRILKAPTVQYANGSAVAPAPNGKWRIDRNGKFLYPAELPKWSAVFIQYKDFLSFNDFKQFVRMFEREMKNRGIQFAPLDDYDIIQVPANEQALDKLMKDSYDSGYGFLLLGHPDKETRLHSYIKGLERKFDVITQCVSTKTIGNVLKNKMLSLENIVAKTNVKNGGVNYNCLLNNVQVDPSILFIGLGMNHPGGGIGTPSNVEPVAQNGTYNGPFSVLGFAANDGKVPNEFIGNFFLQPVNRDEKVTVLDSLVREVMERFIKNRGKTPSRVIFYRNGCSEGAFIKVLRYEVPIIRTMVHEKAPDAKVSVIIPSKAHSVRLFNLDINPGAKADEQNIRPGTVVDTGIVSMSFSEFYLNSHLALQGTAKATKYTILYTEEEANMPMDQFQRWTNALAYEFQIVSSPTSLPAPVYIANRYAERGRQILNTFQTSEQANREGELEAEKKNQAAGVTNGANLSNGNGGHGDGQNTTDGKADSNIRMGKAPGQLSAFYQKSVDFNFTKRSLRTKRVNA